MYCKGMPTWRNILQYTGGQQRMQLRNLTQAGGLLRERVRLQLVRPRSWRWEQIMP